MPRIRTLIAALFALIPLGLVMAPGAAHAEKRIALVIGNAAYQAGGPLNTPANDAGLIAQTLQAAGFDVVGARDLDQDSLRHAFRDFVEKATSSGPDTVAFVYVGGYGLQLEGENYFVPVDAKIARDSEIPAEALRISDYSRPLAALKLKAGIVVLDAARANPFAKSGPPLAGGLALVEPEPGLLIAFNAAPGTVAPEGQGPYGPYAQALAEMLREGGLPLTGVFDRARLRVNDMTAGAEVPWHASKLQASLVFFERAADAPPPAVSIEETAAIRARPIRDLGAQDGYVLALERDTIEGYSDFLAAYPGDPMANRVRAIVAARREAITWRRTRVVDTPPAYWSYLRRYPEGPHAGDAHRRLAYLAAAFEPPPRFAVLAYDVLPPPPEEIVYISRPVLVFNDPVFGFFAPPPAPIIFLAPPPPEFVVLAAPPVAIGLFVLPIPVYHPVPVWVAPPAYVVAPPANNVIYNNIHNTVVVNNVTNTVSVTNQSGQTTTIQPPPPAPAQAGAAGTPGQASVATIGPSLPPSVAQKAALQSQNPPVGAGTGPTGSAPATKPAPGQALPGMQGQPLPAAATPGTPPGAKPSTPASPSAAATPGASTPAPGSAKPGTPAGAKPVTPASPSAAVTPNATTPAPGSAKPGTPAGAKPVTPVSPSAAVTPGTSSPAAPPSGAKPATASPPSGGGAKPGKPPQSPAAKLTPPASTPPATAAPAGTGAPPPTPAKPATAYPQAPAAKLAPPPPPPPKPAAAPPPPPPRVAAPPPPPARIAAPPPPPPPRPPAPAMAPAAAAAKPAGCPPGKSMAVVNGQPGCR